MKRLFLVSLSLLLVGSAAQAKSADLKWMGGPPGLPEGATFAVVSGDPGKAGNFTVEIKMPADYAVRPHWHPTDETVKVHRGKLRSEWATSSTCPRRRRLRGRQCRGAESDEPLAFTPPRRDHPGEREGPVADHLRQPKGRPT